MYSSIGCWLWQIGQIKYREANGERQKKPHRTRSTKTNNNYNDDDDDDEKKNETNVKSIA